MIGLVQVMSLSTTVWLLVGLVAAFMCLLALLTILVMGAYPLRNEEMEEDEEDDESLLSLLVGLMRAILELPLVNQQHELHFMAPQPAPAG